jgi:hypothetical protein
MAGITIVTMGSSSSANADPVGVMIERLLEENGLWLVTVHNHRIVKLSKVPKPELLEERMAEQSADPADEAPSPKKKVAQPDEAADEAEED